MSYLSEKRKDPFTATFLLSITFRLTIYESKYTIFYTNHLYLHQLIGGKSSATKRGNTDKWIYVYKVAVYRSESFHKKEAHTTIFLENIFRLLGIINSYSNRMIADHLLFLKLLKFGLIFKIFFFKCFIFHPCFLRFHFNIFVGLVQFLQTKTSSTICQITLKDVKAWTDTATDEEMFC